MLHRYLKNIAHVYCTYLYIWKYYRVIWKILHIYLTILHIYLKILRIYLKILYIYIWNYWRDICKYCRDIWKYSRNIWKICRYIAKILENLQLMPSAALSTLVDPETTAFPLWWRCNAGERDWKWLNRHDWKRQSSEMVIAISIIHRARIWNKIGTCH